jgi:hypothetical protein
MPNDDRRLIIPDDLESDDQAYELKIGLIDGEA